MPTAYCAGKPTSFLKVTDGPARGVFGKARGIAQAAKAGVQLPRFVVRERPQRDGQTDCAGQEVRLLRDGLQPLVPVRVHSATLRYRAAIRAIWGDIPLLLPSPAPRTSKLADA